MSNCTQHDAALLISKIVNKLFAKKVKKKTRVSELRMIANMRCENGTGMFTFTVSVEEEDLSMTRRLMEEEL